VSTVEIHQRRWKPVILITTRHPDLAWKRKEREKEREDEEEEAEAAEARLFREGYTRPYLSAEILFPS